MKRIISGIQPSNKLTLGNYLGAIKQFVDLQNKYEMYIFVADLHALSGNFTPTTLFENKKSLVATYAALGLNLSKNIIFFQSAVPAHTQLSWILTCNTTMGILNKMTQFKDKTAKVVLANGTSMVSTGLFMYPVLMAADIMLYDADYVAVGIDQKQHVELTRDIAEKMNKKYGALFKISEPLIPKHGAKIMDLLNPTIKMSKSNVNENGTIFLLDTSANVTKKIMSAKTDSFNTVKFDVVNQPGISNLLTIYSCLSGDSIDNIVKEYHGKNYGEFKKALVEIVTQFIIKFQNEYHRILKDESKLDKQLAINAQKCIKLTEIKMTKVNKAIGINK